MRQALMDNLAPIMSADQFFPQQQSPAIAASLTSELISSIVAASHSSSTSHSSNTSNNNIKSNSHSNSTAEQRLSDSNNRKTRGTTCVAAPRISRSSLATLEYSVHASPRRMTRDLATVFPSIDLANLLVVPTFQKCQYEMVAWDAVIAKEKDDRLDDFIRWSTALHQGLEKLGYWSDMTDPASGFPSFGERGRDVYPDVEGCQMLLKYDFQNAGCCKVLLHPVWGSKIYPATFFTTAPADVLLSVVEQTEQQFRVPEP